MTLRVALTGGIASGKSYVRAKLAAKGTPTVDADGIVHELLGPGAAVAGEVVNRFGPGVAREDGSIDRRALASLVFEDPQARADLEAIIHPAVYARIAAWLAAVPRSAAVAVADIPLLYETGREGAFDRVVVVACDPALQVQRVMLRDGLTEGAARARLAAQWPIGRKVERADFVIWTDGSFEETDRQVDDVLARLDALARIDPGL